MDGTRRCAAMQSRADARTIVFHISRKADLILPILDRQIVLRSEPTITWKESARARPLTFGAANMTRVSHSSDTRPRTLLEDLKVCSSAVSACIFLSIRHRQVLEDQHVGSVRLPPEAGYTFSYYNSSAPCKSKTKNQRRSSYSHFL